MKIYRLIYKIFVTIVLLAGTVSAFGQLESGIGRPMYIRSEGALLYLHASGGSNPGATETLHPCPKKNNHPNCQWETFARKDPY
uniref:Uncharacterized protein n=1 Tax=Candidatus Kentrum sp. LPFa TaxID=2126335 RepID=A0A450Y4N9_9GAMM|nr:MAG: hypothetical protein BECKLPF1236A_GA0070988_106371 [Candidatus Kentron sp. LPFa]VFK36508.1 MAG: hypothetical protein BECKLPF1236C_GA0070990_106261 [Candidatus Kentron sp. LPFa]